MSVFVKQKFNVSFIYAEGSLGSVMADIVPAVFN